MPACVIKTVGNRAPPHACFIAPPVYESGGTDACGLRQICGRDRGELSNRPLSHSPVRFQPRYGSPTAAGSDGGKILIGPPVHSSSFQTFSIFDPKWLNMASLKRNFLKLSTFSGILLNDVTLMLEKVLKASGRYLSPFLSY